MECVSDVKQKKGISLESMDSNGIVGTVDFVGSIK